MAVPLPLPRYRVRVPPPVLRWARETSGLSVAEAAGLANVTPDRLAAWEAGNDEVAPPTVAQVRLLAAKYHRPVSVFLRPEPPPERLLPTYARHLHGASTTSGSRHLRFAVREACEKRAIAFELLSEIGDTAPAFVSVDLTADAEDTGEQVRRILDVDIDTLTRWASNGDTLRGWIDRLDAAGVLVIQYANVAVDERRGFSIVDQPLPVIALNEGDAATARTFTLLHEFAHILRAAAGLDADAEVWCNAVAASALVPRNGALACLRDAEDWRPAGIAIATRFGVSREAAYRRLLTLGAISEVDYKEIRDELLAEPKAKRRGGGPDWPVGQVRRVGRSFIGIVASAYDRDAISLHDASRYLGVQGKHVEPLIEAAWGRTL